MEEGKRENDRRKKNIYKENRTNDRIYPRSPDITFLHIALATLTLPFRVDISLTSA